MAKISTSKTLTYPALADLGDRTHVQIIQGMILDGADKGAVLDAYVIARYPEIEAGTLLRENHGATPRILDNPKAVNRAKALLRKHGNTHFKMAEADMSPATVQARREKAAASVAKAEQNLANAKVRAGSATKAQAIA